MHPRLALALLVLGGTALLCAQVSLSEPTLVDYPAGFAEWRHLGSVVSEAKDDRKAAAPHGLIHHLYGNAAAIEGLRTGRFPEGAVFVADWFALAPKYPGSRHEGARDRTDVMVKDARFAATGGWGYEQFAGDSRTQRTVAGAAPNACFKCHEAVRARDYVFTRLRS
jgi:hypothetical protein